MIVFRFIGSVDYTEDLQNKKAQIGDTYHVTWEGKRGDKHPKFVNAVYVIWVIGLMLNVITMTRFIML